MDLLDNASIVFQLLIRSGAVLRVAYCFLRMALHEEEAMMYRKRIRNAIVFLVLSELVWVLKSVAIFYFS